MNTEPCSWHVSWPELACINIYTNMYITRIGREQNCGDYSVIAEIRASPLSPTEQITKRKEREREKQQATAYGKGAKGVFLFLSPSGRAHRIYQHIHHNNTENRIAGEYSVVAGCFLFVTFWPCSSVPVRKKTLRPYRRW